MVAHQRGARVDLGILERTDRIWGSDSNDALERQTIQRYTQLLLLPPELIGCHVGPPRAHTTGRTQTLSIAIYESVQAGQDGKANALVILTSVVCIVILLLAARLVGGRRRELRDVA